jgi:hypothetical protein
MCWRGANWRDRAGRGVAPAQGGQPLEVTAVHQHLRTVGLDEVFAAGHRSHAAQKRERGPASLVPG